ncbi:flagellar motor switch protein FliN/FliY [Nitrosovibrio sp. Nv6]|nr:flagellar motor switch protein FliN [Nitrosovibrio sp. Nv6]SEO48822.1 flagellar motor switch protein FliN/FliY [Nitrosovibrio sp. Nv6]
MSSAERRNLSKRPFTNKPEEMNVSATQANSAPLTTEREDAATAAADGDPAPIFEQFTGTQKVQIQNDIDMIMDIPVQLTVQLGRTKIAIKNLLQLAQGSVVELDGLAGEPMDVLVNGYLIAQGEVVVVNEKFGIRLTDIITPSERIRKLNR